MGRGCSGSTYRLFCFLERPLTPFSASAVPFRGQAFTIITYLVLGKIRGVCLRNGAAVLNRSRLFGRGKNRQVNGLVNDEKQKHSRKRCVCVRERERERDLSENMLSVDRIYVRNTVFAVDERITERWKTIAPHPTPTPLLAVQTRGLAPCYALSALRDMLSIAPTWCN